MNPTEALVEKARQMGYADDDINVVSLGCGDVSPDLGIDDVKANDLLYWQSKYQKEFNIDSMPINQVRDVEKRMKGLKNYVRLQPLIDDEEKIIKFDDSKSQALKTMGRIACTHISENQQAFEKMKLMIFNK